MNVTLFSFNWDGIHLATELELAKNHNDAGDKVTVVICNQIVTLCANNIHGEKLKCNHCTAKRIHLFQSINVDVVLLSSYGPEQSDATTFSSKQLVTSATHEGHPFGRLVTSTYASMKRKLEFSERDLLIMSQMYQASVTVYKASSRLLESHPCDLAYVFNQRFAPIHGVVGACRDACVPLISHERGAKPNMYSLYPEGKVHDQNQFELDCRDSYAKSGLDLATSTAETYFKSRRQNRPSDGYCFTAIQQIGELPTEYSLSDENVVLFLSSDDEFYFLGDDWVDPVFGTQFEAVNFLVSEYSGSAKFWIRCHPNMATMDPSIVTQYRNLVSGLDNWHFIEPESTVSTYRLVDVATKVITFGSTVGIEAAYWNKVSICLGKSFYRNLGSTYVPKTKAEALTLIDGELIPLPRLGAIMYGNHCSTFGIEMETYSPIDVRTGTYDGIFIDNVYSSNLAATCIATLNRNRVLPKVINSTMRGFFHELKYIHERSIGRNR